MRRRSTRLSLPPRGHRLCLGFDPQRVSPAALIARITARHAVRDLFVENPPIEAIVARLYQSTAGESKAAEAVKVCAG